MADDSVVRIMESLGLDYNPAIQSTLKFEKYIADLQAQLITMKATAGQTAKDVGTSFSTELSKLKSQGLGISTKDAAQSKTILDQFGNTLIELGKDAEKSAQSQAKYNKELAELIHLRKTFQIDAQTFVDKASPFRTNESTWSDLQKSEQVKLVQELTKAETEHRKVLDEKLKAENAINETQKETVQGIKQSTLASMDASAASIQQKATAKGLSDEYKLQATLIRNQISELQQKLATEGKLSAEEVKQTAQLKEQLSILKSQQRADIADTPKQTPNMLGNEFSRRSSWFLTGTAFYGGINAGKEAVQTISEVEMGVKEIARVMEDNTFVFKDYRDELLQLGVDYGNTFDTVQDISLRWAQAGYNVKDSLENTKTSLLALNTAELDAKASTEDLIGIMAQWQLTSKDLPLLLDKVNKTADDFTVTSQDLVDGLLRSSGAAKIMGLSLDQTIALLTVMREASGRTGREVGNALNSILSYVQRPSAIKTFESLGIQVFADAAKTQFRNVMEIFQDVAAKWNTLAPEIQDGFVKAADDAGLFNEELAQAIGIQDKWNDLQQRDLSQAMAGTYRRNYIIGLIERLATAQKVLNNMTDAAGYSMRENANTMDTLEKKYNSLKTSAQQLAIAIGDAGLLDALKALADGAKDSIQWFNGLDQEWKTLIITAGELLAIVGALKAVAGLFTTKNLILGAGSVASLLPGWGKLIGLIGAATGAVALYAHNSKSASDESVISASKILASKLQEKDSIEKLISKYESLRAKVSLTESEQQDLKSIVSQLAEIYPNLTASINDTTGALDNQIGAIKRLNETQKNALLQQTKINIAKTQAEIGQYGKEYKEISDLLTDTIDFANKMDTFQTWAQRYKTVYGKAPTEADMPEDVAKARNDIIDEKGFYRKYKSLLDSIMTQGYFENDTRNALDKIILEYSAKASELTQKTLDLEANQKLLNDISNGKFDSPANTSEGPTRGNSGGDGSGNSTGGGYLGDLEKYTLNIDRYMKLNAVLDSVNAALDLNNVLQDEVDGPDRIKFIEQENALLEKKRKAINDIWWERKQERDEIRLNMESQGFSFDESGSIQNYDSRIRELTAYVNAMSESNEAQKQSKKAATDNLRQLEDWAKRYVDLVHKDIPSAEKEFVSIRGEINKNVKAIEELNQKASDDAFDKASKSLEHWSKMGVYSIQQQIDKYRELYSLKQFSVDEEWKMQEALQDKYKDLIEDRIKKAKEASEESIKAIEKEYKAMIDAEDAKLRKLDEAKEVRDRIRSIEDFEKKRQELLEKRRYHEMRTGEEHRQAIIDIDKELAELQVDMTRQTEDWKTEDEKAGIEERKRQLEQEKTDKVNAVKDAWAKVEKVFTDSNINLIASAGVNAENLFKEYDEKFLKPLEAKFSNLNFNKSYSGGYNLPDVDSITKGAAGTITGPDWKSIRANVNEIVWHKGEWTKAYQAGDMDSMNAHSDAALPYYANLEKDSYGKQYAEKLRKMGYQEAFALLKDMPIAHTGAKTIKEGAYWLAPGELVVRPDLTRALESFLTPFRGGNTAGTSSTSVDNRREIKIGNLLNIENNHMAGDVDGGILSRELQRAVMAIK